MPGLKIQSALRDFKSRASAFNKKISVLALQTCRAGTNVELQGECTRTIQLLSKEVQNELLAIHDYFGNGVLEDHPEKRRLELAVERIRKDLEQMLRYMNLLLEKMENNGKNPVQRDR